LKKILLNYILLGVRALYKGLGPTLMRTFPATGALFLAVETTRKVLGNAADDYGIKWYDSVVVFYDE